MGKHVYVSLFFLYSCLAALSLDYFSPLCMPYLPLFYINVLLNLQLISIRRTHLYRSPARPTTGQFFSSLVCYLICNLNNLFVFLWIFHFLHQSLGSIILVECHSVSRCSKCTHFFFFFEMIDNDT